jgi:type II secretory pathway pseudopilin PulG
MLHRLVRRIASSRRSDAGETLIELVLAVAIIGIAATALVGAVLTSITGSSEHRSLTVDNTLLNSYVQSVQNTVERQGDLGLFSGCAGPSDLPTPATDSNDASAAGWTVTVTNIKYWPQGGSAFTSCPGSSANIDLLLLTATATSTTHLSSSITFAVRNPKATS